MTKKKKKVEMLYTSLREQDAHNIRAGIHTGEGNAVNTTLAGLQISKFLTKMREVFSLFQSAGCNRARGAGIDTSALDKTLPV